MFPERGRNFADRMRVLQVSIRSAVIAAESGETILIEPGVYEENFEVTLDPGHPRNPRYPVPETVDGLITHSNHT